MKILVKKLTKRQKIKGIVVALSVLLVAVASVSVFFGIKYSVARKQLSQAVNELSELQSSMNVQLSEEASRYNEISENRDFESAAYEAEIENKSKEYQSKVDELNKKINDLNKQLSQKKEQAASSGQTVSSGGQTVYLTFDDGPSAVTVDILNVLDKYSVKATFFVTSGKYNSVMKEIVKRGHSIGLHCYNHSYSAIYKSDEAYFADLQKISDLVLSQTGKESKLIRFPGGSSNTVSKKYSNGIMSRITKSVTEKGYVYFDWNCQTGDAEGITDINKLVKNGTTYPKSAKNIVILMHDTKSATVKALPRIIEFYQKKGMKFAALTVSTAPVHHKVGN